MSQNRKTDILVILIFLFAIVAFAYSYNASVTATVADTAYNDREILHNYNNEVISKLVETDSTDSWGEIVEQYEDIVIVIEDSENKVVTKSVGRGWSAVDVKEQTPFEFKGQVYVIKSSVYLWRDNVANVRELVKFIFVQFLIGLSVLALLIFSIYTIMIRPFRSVYKSIEEYDRTGKLEKKKIKGYAGQVYNRFVSLTENLERQQQNETRIIASISHDIKTPLTSIMGYTEQLKKDSTNDSRKQMYLNTVYDKSVEIQQLIDEFDEYLDFNLAKELRKEKVTAKEIEDYIKSEYLDELRYNDVELTVVNNAGDVSVVIDRQKIKRVLGNIFSNSVKHFNKQEKKIEVLFHTDKDTLIIDIHDNGEGVPEEKLDMIFEPFYTSDQGRKVAGLGLSICREIINSHSGKIYARKSDSDGLTICLELKRTD